MKKTLTISVENNFFQIEEELEPFEELYLRKHFCWCDAMDFNSVEYYYHSGEGYTSMADEIFSILEEKFEYVLEIFDNTTLSEKDFEAKFLAQYREKQEECVNAVVKNRLGIIEACPGFGKTIIMGGIVANIGKKALILTEDTKPLNDAKKAMETFTDIKSVGFLAGDSEVYGDVTVCLIQKVASLLRNKNKAFLDFLKDVKVVVVDECHHTVATSYADIISYLYEQTEYRIGVSATPLMREDGTTIKTKALLGPVRYEVTYGDAIDMGVCVPCTLEYLNFEYEGEVGEEMQGLRNYNSIVKRCIVENYDRNLVYATKAKEYIKEGISCAIIVDKHNHAYNLQKMIPNSVVVLGPDPKELSDREEIWDKLSKKKIMCVISTLLDEAANIPSLGAVLIASNQKTQIRTIQRLRSTRSFKGDTALGYYKKDRAFVFTTIDQAPHLDQHSKTKINILKDYLSQHPANEVHELVG